MISFLYDVEDEDDDKNLFKHGFLEEQENLELFNPNEIINEKEEKDLNEDFAYKINDQKLGLNKDNEETNINLIKNQKTDYKTSPFELINIPIDQNEFKEKFQIKKFHGIKGRKKKSDKEEKERKHNKYSDDNIRRKSKHILIKELSAFINNQIANRDPFSKRILVLNQSQISNATITFNKLFLQKTLQDIFSEKVSSRYNTVSEDHNRKVIFNLINTGNEEKKNYFKKLFSLTFLQCLKHFRKEEEINELKGLTLLTDIMEDIKRKNNEDDYYIEVLYNYFRNYEKIIFMKKARKSGKIKSI
jgi:hypothetical protein